MDTIYHTYDRFIEACRKFPRFMNVRRRYEKSSGGKLLRSIIDEIGAVEEAILDYKKDFFIVNYFGREDDIVAYLYTAEAGLIEDIAAVEITEPALKLTDDKELFYRNLDSYAYYQDGYILIKDRAENIKFNYNKFKYVLPLERQHIWNIFDEFAWWASLERFVELGESNKELMLRTIDVFRERPSSSERGLKNVVKNTLYNYGNIDDDEIVIETPDEKNMALINEDSITLYEEISQFNHDIARTKRFDIDYWDNTFRELRYLPHVFDIAITNYKDGVGYNNSLDVSTVKELDTEIGTDITIYGYKKSEEKIEEYIRSQNLKKSLTIGLKRYLNAMNPVEVQYKINASTLSEIKYPGECYINTYSSSNKLASYPIDILYESDNGITVTADNVLNTNGTYALELLPDGKFITDSCQLVLNEGESDEKIIYDFLQSNEYWDEDSQSDFVINGYNQLISKFIRFFGESINDFNEAVNLGDAETGFKVIDASEKASFKFETEDKTMRTQKTELKLNYTAESFSLVNNPFYVSGKNFTYNRNSKKYEIPTGTAENAAAVLVIELDGNYLEFTVARGEHSSVYVNTYIDNSEIPNMTYSYAPFSTRREAETKVISLPKYSHIRVEIVRASDGDMPIIDNILAKSYKIDVVANGNPIEPSSKETYLLPKAEKTDVEVTINNYGKTEFNISSVIVGSSGITKLTEANSTFTAVFPVSGYNDATGYPSLKVNHNGKVRLKKMVDGKWEYIDSFGPYRSYANTGTDPNDSRDIYLNLDNFEEIRYSVPEIRTASDGRKYITLKNGENLTYVKIYGIYKKPVESLRLSEVLGLKPGDKVYTNQDLEELVINGNRSVRLIRENLISKTANIFELQFSPKETVDFNACFVIDYRDSSEDSYDIRSHMLTYSGPFKYLYIYDKKTKSYVAYNTQTVVQGLTRDGNNPIRIGKSFTPKIPADEKVLYIIEDIVPVNNSHSFKVNFYDSFGIRRWAATDLPIQIEANLSMTDSNSYLCENLELSEEFNLSNHITLAESYKLENEDIELGRYILEVPDFINVIYTDKTIKTETDDTGAFMYVESDGFNKLPHSNIVSIESVTVDGAELDRGDYLLLGEPGHIAWKNEKYYGKPFKIIYTYKKPVELTFPSLDSLYELANYQIDTLERLFITDENGTELPYIVHGLSDGEIYDIDLTKFPEIPEKIAVICSNPVYSATVTTNNDTDQPKAQVNITRIAEDHTVLIHNGWYYIDGEEYWYFSNKHEEDVKSVDGLLLYNVEKLANALHLSRESSNFLSNSRMERNVLNPTAVYNFKHPHTIPNISSADCVGACDTLFEWHTFKMKLAPNSGYDGKAIVFNNEDDSSYAVLDVTKMLRINKLLSVWLDGGNIKCSLGREVLMNGQQLSKSLYFEKVKDFTLRSDKAYCDCSDVDLENYRYYLIVTGYGVLIEILALQLSGLEDIKAFDASFTKTIEKFGLAIDEKITGSSEIEINFVPTNAIVDGLEIAKNCKIQTGTNVDWGITKLKGYDLEKDLLKNRFSYRNGYLVANSNGAMLETLPIRLTAAKSINSLIVKVNDYHVDKLKGFKIEILGANTSDGTYSVISTGQNVNMVTVPNSVILSYIKLRITADETKVISSIEMFAEYNESENSALSIVESSSGTCLTKIFDTGALGRYRFSKVEAEETAADFVSYYIRGMRADNTDNVYTDWYKLDSDHVFRNYRYFQFKIELKSNLANTKINKFILETV